MRCGRYGRGWVPCAGWPCRAARRRDRIRRRRTWYASWDTETVSMSANSLATGSRRLFESSLMRSTLFFGNASAAAIFSAGGGGGWRGERNVPGTGGRAFEKAAQGGRRAAAAARPQAEASQGPGQRDLLRNFRECRLATNGQSGEARAARLQLRLNLARGTWQRCRSRPGGRSLQHPRHGRQPQRRRTADVGAADVSAATTYRWSSPP